jgi:hypothetical protein
VGNSKDDRFRIKTNSLGLGGELNRLVPPVATASFAIHGDAVEPAFWTSYFKCEPSESRIKSGDRGLAPSGRRYAPLPGLWLLSSEAWVADDQLDPHLSFLVTKLALPRPDLGDLLRERKLTCRIFCFWVNDKGDRVPNPRADYLDIFRSCGIGFEIDEYPQQIGVLKDGKTFKAWI